MAKKKNDNQEVVIRFDKVTLIGVTLILVLFGVILAGIVGGLAYMSKPTVIVPTSAPQVAPINGDITINNNEPTLVFPTAVINGATALPDFATTEKRSFPTEMIPTIEALGTSMVETAQAFTPKQTITPMQYEATAEAKSTGVIKSGQAYRDQVDKEYAEAMKTGKCIRSIALPDEIFVCPNALIGGRPDFCGFCKEGVEGCPHPGEYYYCINLRLEIPK